MDNTISEKLRKIRKYRGLSLDSVCEKIGFIVSKQALFKYEKGLMNPSKSVLDAILKVYGIDQNTLYGQHQVTVRDLNYRYIGHLSAKDEKTLKSDIIMMLEKYFILEQLLSDHIAYKAPLSKRQIELTYDGMEKATLDIRRKWNLGHDMIPSVCRMLESSGIKVLEMDLSENIDGLCGWANRKAPFIVLNKNVTVERKRFTALHEFAHLLFPFPKEMAPNQIERLCHRFSSSFLLPVESTRLYLGLKRSRLTIDELSAVRTNYGISIAAIVHRLKDLSVITEDYYNKIFDNYIKMNKMEVGWGQYPLTDSPLRYQALVQRACAEELLKPDELESGLSDDLLVRIEKLEIM